MRGIDLKKIAEKMNGASGAELKVYFFFSFASYVWFFLLLYNRIKNCPC